VVSGSEKRRALGRCSRALTERNFLPPSQLTGCFVAKQETASGLLAKAEPPAKVGQKRSPAIEAEFPQVARQLALMSKSIPTIVRAATVDDAPAVSRVILDALRQSNAKDYSPEVIERVGASFSPLALLNLFEQREVFVAVYDERIVGTASLDGRAVRTVFVAPEVQRRGVGRRLMEVVEDAARKAGIEVLVVPSSVTAEQFYADLGFKAVRDSFHGEERTIIMERALMELRRDRDDGE
jgi:predicted N-acetyltransferase YhbS